eukprot:TRINITY_DN8501_c0_g1_i1.p1 TRINITY_DN8501_c0_g1~~TRINITY_DN8501_c0_g1_i1.p1  ORF type:complete len:467 (-),score=107.74 TRINITY_DN8501_c0_g1_i1:169-1497(-)
MSPEARRQKKREVRERMEMRASGELVKQSMNERMAAQREIALSRTEWENANLGGYKRLYPSLEKEQEYWDIHEAAVNIWETLMGGTSRRSVRLTQTEDPPEEPATKKPSKNQASQQKDKNEGEREPPVVQKRTAEELKEVVERLMNGCSAHPRKGTARRRGSTGSSLQEAAAISEEQTPNPVDKLGLAAGASQKSMAGRPLDKAGRPEVQVGDVIKVQTNLGWEIVTVRAKRSTGKLDIQFKDGEFMRSVLPRICRDANGVPLLTDVNHVEPASSASVTEEKGGSSSSTGSSSFATMALPLPLPTLQKDPPQLEQQQQQQQQQPSPQQPIAQNPLFHKEQQQSSQPMNHPILPFRSAPVRSNTTGGGTKSPTGNSNSLQNRNCGSSVTPFPSSWTVASSGCNGVSLPTPGSLQNVVLAPRVQPQLVGPKVVARFGRGNSYSS